MVKKTPCPALQSIISLNLEAQLFVSYVCILGYSVCGAYILKSKSLMECTRFNILYDACHPAS